jgi:hypothetical protein
LERENGESFEQAVRYFSSEENITKCQPFILECQRYSDKIMKFGMTYQAIYKETSAKVIKEEYGVGGETIQRGFYNPSPIVDIVMGNANRGKILKRITPKSKPVRKYLFDEFGMLVLVENFPLNIGCKEIIIRQNDMETGISFDDNGIQALSECIYRGNQILSYVFCLYNTYESRVFDYTKEEFEYSESGLTDVYIDRFFNSPNAPILRQETYRFKHDMEGYLSQYTIIEKDNGISKNTQLNDEWFDIKIKRKV